MDRSQNLIFISVVAGVAFFFHHYSTMTGVSVFNTPFGKVWNPQAFLHLFYRRVGWLIRKQIYRLEKKFRGVKVLLPVLQPNRSPFSHGPYASKRNGNLSLSHNTAMTHFLRRPFSVVSGVSHIKIIKRRRIQCLPIKSICMCKCYDIQIKIQQEHFHDLKNLDNSL